MKKWCMVGVLLLLAGNVLAQAKFDAWHEFAKTKFEPKYNEKLGEYIFFPNFPAELKALVGKEVTVEGYYVPFAPEDSQYIILSKYPQSQCFFCGGGGPESVIEVNFTKSPSRFKVDDVITVKGKLTLNPDDMDHVNFILKEAAVVNK